MTTNLNNTDIIAVKLIVSFITHMYPVRFAKFF